MSQTYRCVLKVHFLTYDERTMQSKKKEGKVAVCYIRLISEKERGQIWVGFIKSSFGGRVFKEKGGNEEEGHRL